MATTYMMNNLVVSCLMFFVMSGSLNAQPADTKAICGKAQNPSFCTNYMSRPNTSGADIKTLAKVTFSTAQVTATNGVTRFQNLAARETNPALKKALTSCMEQYNNISCSLNAGDDPAQMKVKASAAMKGLTTCQDGLAKFKADPSIAKTTQLSMNYQDNFQDICGIILVIYGMM